MKNLEVSPGWSPFPHAPRRGGAAVLGSKPSLTLGLRLFPPEITVGRYPAVQWQEQIHSWRFIFWCSLGPRINDFEHNSFFSFLVFLWDDRSPWYSWRRMSEFLNEHKSQWVPRVLNSIWNVTAANITHRAFASVKPQGSQQSQWLWRNHWTWYPAPASTQHSKWRFLDGCGRWWIWWITQDLEKDGGWMWMDVDGESWWILMDLGGSWRTPGNQMVQFCCRCRG